MGKWISRLTWVALVVGLLITNAFLTTRQAGVPNPSVTSFGPSGQAVFAELLRREGYSVRVDTRSQPRLAPGEVPIYLSYGLNQDFLAEQKRGEPQTVVPLMILIDEFGNDSTTTRGELIEKVSEVRWQSGTPDRTYQVNAVRRFSEPDTFQKSLASATNKDGKFSLVDMAPLGREFAVLVQSGYLFSNELISEEDNARFALDLVALVAKPGAKLVFCEAGIGNVTETSLWQDMGSWAHFAYLQLLGVLLLAVWSKNRLIGAKGDWVFEERGARDLVDGLGGVFRRGKMDYRVLNLHKARIDSRIKHTFALHSRDAEPFELLKKHLPEAVEPYQAAFVRQTNSSKPSPELIHSLNALDQALDHWERRTRKARGGAGKTSS